jgi:hypothetical protein
VRVCIGIRMLQPNEYPRVDEITIWNPPPHALKESNLADGLMRALPAPTHDVRPAGARSVSRAGAGLRRWRCVRSRTQRQDEQRRFASGPYRPDVAARSAFRRLSMASVAHMYGVRLWSMSSGERVLDVSVMRLWPASTITRLGSVAGYGDSIDHDCGQASAHVATASTREVASPTPYIYAVSPCRPGRP